MDFKTSRQSALDSLNNFIENDILNYNSLETIGAKMKKRLELIDAFYKTNKLRKI